MSVNNGFHLTVKKSHKRSNQPTSHPKIRDIGKQKSEPLYVPSNKIRGNITPATESPTSFAKGNTHCYVLKLIFSLRTVRLIILVCQLKKKRDALDHGM